MIVQFLHNFLFSSFFVKLNFQIKCKFSKLYVFYSSCSVSLKKLWEFYCVNDFFHEAVKDYEGILSIALRKWAWTKLQQK